MELNSKQIRVLAVASVMVVLIGGALTLAASRKRDRFAFLNDLHPVHSESTEHRATTPRRVLGTNSEVNIHFESFQFRHDTGAVLTALERELTAKDGWSEQRDLPGFVEFSNNASRQHCLYMNSAVIQKDASLDCIVSTYWSERASWMDQTVDLVTGLWSGSKGGKRP